MTKISFEQSLRFMNHAIQQINSTVCFKLCLQSFIYSRYSLKLRTTLLPLSPYLQLLSLYPSTKTNLKTNEIFRIVSTSGDKKRKQEKKSKVYRHVVHRFLDLRFRCSTCNTCKSLRGVKDNPAVESALESGAGENEKKKRGEERRAEPPS